MIVLNRPLGPPFKAVFPSHADVAIITIIDEELSAVRKIFGLDKLLSEDRDYYWGEVQCGETRRVIVCAQSGEIGNVPAAELASDIIERWKPQVLLVAGIAGGVSGRGIALGDVVVHNGLIYYELQNIIDGERYQRFMEIEASSWILLQVAKRIAIQAVKWYEWIGVSKPDGTQTPPKMHTGLILSGDKLLADPNSAELKRLLQQYDRALAVEMESGGVARAIYEKHGTHRVEFLTVRGISDYCNETENQATREEWRNYAARAAAAVAFELLRQFKAPVDGEEKKEQRGERVRKEIKKEQRVASIIAGLDSIKLARYRIVGNCVRYEESARESLKTLKQKILTGLTTPGPKNYLIWAPTGIGKTFFVNQIANSAQNVSAYEINLAGVKDEKNFRSKLDEAVGSQRPGICLIDEIDKKQNEPWPYDVLLPYLYPTGKEHRKNTPRAFILAGSSGSTLEKMIKIIQKLPSDRDVKSGGDLISRIPLKNRYSIPAMTPLDKVVVTMANIKEAEVTESKRHIIEVEKLALYYISQNAKLDETRQLRQFVSDSLSRIKSPEEDTLTG